MRMENILMYYRFFDFRVIPRIQGAKLAKDSIRFAAFLGLYPSLYELTIELLEHLHGKRVWNEPVHDKTNWANTSIGWFCHISVLLLFIYSFIYYLFIYNYLFIHLNNLR